MASVKHMIENGVIKIDNPHQTVRVEKQNGDIVFRGPLHSLEQENVYNEQAIRAKIQNSILVITLD